MIKLIRLLAMVLFFGLIPACIHAGARINEDRKDKDTLRNGGNAASVAQRRGGMIDATIDPTMVDLAFELYGGVNVEELKGRGYTDEHIQKAQEYIQCQEQEARQQQRGSRELKQACGVLYNGRVIDPDWYETAAARGGSSPGMPYCPHAPVIMRVRTAKADGSENSQGGPRAEELARVSSAQVQVLPVDGIPLIMMKETEKRSRQLAPVITHDQNNFQTDDSSHSHKAPPAKKLQRIPEPPVTPAPPIPLLHAAPSVPATQGIDWTTIVSHARNGDLKALNNYFAGRMGDLFRKVPGSNLRIRDYAEQGYDAACQQGDRKDTKSWRGGCIAVIEWYDKEYRAWEQKKENDKKYLTIMWGNGKPWPSRK